HGGMYLSLPVRPAAVQLLQYRKECFSLEGLAQSSQSDRSEVQKALSRAGGLFQRWEELLQEDTPISRDELDWSTNELRNCLRAIDWDLEDLHETISIVESNPGKFRLGENELQERREFVERTRTAVQVHYRTFRIPSPPPGKFTMPCSAGSDRDNNYRVTVVVMGTR
ncbi:hypothetical protein NFI96_032846, partial [Prochilodus magdalenae]